MELARRASIEGHGQRAGPAEHQEKSPKLSRLQRGARHPRAAGPDQGASGEELLYARQLPLMVGWDRHAGQADQRLGGKRTLTL